MQYHSTKWIYWTCAAILLIFAVLPAQSQTGNSPPNTPQLLAPSSGATAVQSPVILNIAASDVNGDRLTITFYGRQYSATSDFVIAVYGDTQNYYSTFTSTGTDYFKAQSQWLAANRASKNVAFVGHVGDVTNTNVSSEWSYASNAMAPLEDPSTTGLPDGIPFDVAVGNHDKLGGSTALYNSSFGTSRFSGRDYYGGHYSTTNDNHYELFSAGGMDFIAIEFAYSVSSSTLSWANQLLQQYSNRRAIIISHAMIGSGSSASWTGDGQTIYNALKGNPNLFLMLCGHMGGEGKRADVYNGHTVYTLMNDYSGEKNGGNGFIRLLTFSPANNKIHVTTYSPSAGNRTSSAVWDLPYQMDSGGFTVLGTTTVAAGSNATTTWTDLSSDAQYEWYATVSDGFSTTTGPKWTFTTSTQLSPAAPSNLTATAVSSTEVNLAWTDNADNESGFKVERSTDNVNFTQIVVLDANVTTYKDTGLASATYSYRVRSTNTRGDSTYSNTASASTAPMLPAAPTNLTAASSGSAQVGLNWTDNASNESGFRIERSLDGATFSTVNSTNANVTSYSDTTVATATKYYYRVLAYNTAGNSGYSNVVTVSTGQAELAAPSGLTATSAGSTQINLAWADNAGTESGFEIQRSLDGNIFAVLASVGANATSYSDTGLLAATMYYYRVRAFNAGGSSAFSNTATATTTGGGLPSNPVTVVQQNQNSGIYNSFGKASGTQQIFETITVPAGQLAQVRFYLNHKGTTTDSLRVDVRDLSGNLVATSSAIAFSQGGFYTFAFSPAISLSAGKYYFVLSRTGPLSDANFYYVREYGSDIYPAGNVGASPQTSWSPKQWTWDLEFYVDYIGM